MVVGLSYFMLRFIHCADLHLDTPFKGLAEVDESVARDLRQATFNAFERIVQLAMKEQVDFVAIAGDVFDCTDKSLKAQLDFRKGLLELNDAGIPVFVSCGNHDPLDGWTASLQWPENTHRFAGDKVEMLPVEKDGKPVAWIYGTSFPKRDVHDNLAKKFKRNDDGKLPAVAVLHANVGSNTGHESYAPATVEDLKTMKMDYWALGHVHTRNIISPEHPAIAYPGCSQARNPRETGEKGCFLVALDSNGSCNIEFHSCDTVRFQHVAVDIGDVQDIDAVIMEVLKRCEESAKDDVNLILRVKLTGRTPLNNELKRGGVATDLLDTLRSNLTGRSPWLWLEKLSIECQGDYNLDELRQGRDFVAELIGSYDKLNGSGEELEKLREELAPLLQNWQGAKFLEMTEKEELLELACQARNATLDLLVDD